jgi:CDP-diacylglycerol--serine O-phosphatidyltransferase
MFTVGNLFCGYLSLSDSIQGRFERAAFLIFVAGLLDLLDGRLARLTGTTSEFGEEYDSLADLVSFGMAPSLLLYFWGFSQDPGLRRLGFLVSFLFVVCGSMRLARFNIQTHVVDKRYFVGLPIPMAAAVPASIVLTNPKIQLSRLGVILVLGVALVVSYLMVSTIRYRSFKDLDLKRRRPLRVMLLIALVIIFIGYEPALALPLFACTFALSGPAAKAYNFLRASFRGHS